MNSEPVFVVEIEELSTRYKIRPEDIDISDRLRGAFGSKILTEKSYWIVRLCQSKGIWCPISMNELENFCISNGLPLEEYITLFPDLYDNEHSENQLTYLGYFVPFGGASLISQMFIDQLWQACPMVR